MGESAILTVSDLHYGKRTNGFNPNTLERRLDALADRLAKRLSGVDELVVCILGDVNDGTGIYPTQIHHQDITDPNEQAQLLSDALARFFTTIHETVKTVRGECVPGNHGRSGKFAHEAANWDNVAYDYLKLKLNGIPIRRNGGADFIRKVGLRGHRYLMYHGHGIRMYQSIPWYGIAQRLMRWNTTHLAPFDVALFGHFHICGDMPFNDKTALISGTPIIHDEWALQELGLESVPQWWLFGVDDKRPVTWQEKIEL